MTDSPTLKRLQQEHPEWCFKCGASVWEDGHGSAEGHVCRVPTGLTSTLTTAKLEDEARIAELTRDLESGFMAGAYARLKQLQVAEAQLCAAKLEDEATIREKDARIAELEQAFESNRRAIEAVGAVLTFPIPSKPKPYSWNNGNSIEDFTTFVSALDSWGTECFAQNQALRAQLSSEQAAHAAAKEELRKVDEALFKSADWADAHGYGFLAEFEAALARQAQRAAEPKETK